MVWAGWSTVCFQLQLGLSSKTVYQKELDFAQFAALFEQWPFRNSETPQKQWYARKLRWIPEFGGPRFETLLPDLTPTCCTPGIRCFSTWWWRQKRRNMSGAKRKTIFATPLKFNCWRPTWPYLIGTTIFKQSFGEHPAIQPFNFQGGYRNFCNSLFHPIWSPPYCSDLGESLMGGQRKMYFSTLDDSMKARINRWWRFSHGDLSGENPEHSIFEM